MEFVLNEMRRAAHDPQIRKDEGKVTDNKDNKGNVYI